MPTAGLMFPDLDPVIGAGYLQFLPEGQLRRAPVDAGSAGPMRGMTVAVMGIVMFCHTALIPIYQEMVKSCL